jgi:hypothetical protein
MTPDDKLEQVAEAMLLPPFTEAKGIAYQNATKPSVILDLLARARAAEAIASRLPKTADGVPIVPGMQLWLSEPERPLVSRIASWREFNNAAEEIYVYSTRAAAESASQSQAKAEGGGR